MGAGAVEECNELAQEASDRCCKCPCPKCGRTFLPDRLQAHVRTCEEEPDPDAEPAPAHSWGPITRVGGGWELEELQRFCRHKRLGAASAVFVCENIAVFPSLPPINAFWPKIAQRRRRCTGLLGSFS